MIRMAFGLGALCLLLALGVVLYRFGAELAREAAQELQAGKDGDETAPPAAPETMAPETKAAETAPAAPAPETVAPSSEHAAAPSSPATPVVPEAAPAAPAALETPAQPMRTHKVASGDSLWKLSVQYYGSATHVAELMQANQLTAATLRPGQVLVIPEIAGTKAADAADAPVNADHEVAQGSASNETVTDQAATPAPATAPAASGSGDSPFVPMPPSL